MKNNKNIEVLINEIVLGVVHECHAETAFLWCTIYADNQARTISQDCSSRVLDQGISRSFPRALLARIHTVGDQNFMPTLHG